MEAKAGGGFSHSAVESHDGGRFGGKGQREMQGVGSAEGGCLHGHEQSVCMPMNLREQIGGLEDPGIKVCHYLPMQAGQILSAQFTLAPAPRQSRYHLGDGKIRNHQVLSSL